MKKTLLINFILCFTLTACGGGGGSSDSPADNENADGDGKEIISDFTPDDFFFLEASNHETSAEVISNEITLSGLSLDTPISVENGLYSVNGTAPTSEASTVTSGDKVKIFITTSAEYQTTTTATLLVGTLAVNFNATTRAMDAQPSFTAPATVSDADLNSYVESGDITFTEFDGDQIIITGAQYKINGSDWVEPGTLTIKGGDVLVLRLKMSHLYDEQTSSNASGSDWSFNFNAITPETGELTVFVEQALAKDGSTVITASEEFTLKFSESMLSNTLNFGGDMPPQCNDLSCLNLAWSDNDSILTVSPKEDFYWYANKRNLTILATGNSDAELNETVSATVLPVFETFQAADMVIGQANFTSDSHNISSRSLAYPDGVTINTQGDHAVLLITDSSNNRVLKYDPVPSSNYAVYSEIFGQDSSITRNSGDSNHRLNGPNSAVEFNERIYITDTDNDRAVWVSSENFNAEGDLELSGQATSLVGQTDFDQVVEGECSQNSLGYAGGSEVVNTDQGIQWLISDTSSSRIMIWSNPDESKGTDANLVLGKPNFIECNRPSVADFGLEAVGLPTDVWSNGKKVIVPTDDNRLLVWREFPTQNNEIADFQIGQLDDYSSARNAGQQTNQRGMADLYGIGGNNHQICVADRINNRVLIWLTLPDSSEDLANVVIGQSDFTKNTPQDTDQNGVKNSHPDELTLEHPKDCDISMEQLFIADTNNSRVLVYNALNKRPSIN